MQGGAPSSYTVRFIGERVYAARVDPAIVEVEHRANSNGEIDGVVLPTGSVQRLHVFGCDARRIVIHLIDEPEKRFVFFVQFRSLQIPQHTPHQIFVAQ